MGDITKIKGCTAPVVDCIIGGSPCQDLSLAGKRAGLAGARSGLYMEQIRIIKEMRYADVQRGNTDVDVRPRYMVWENVPGAFSTNGGKDFAAVLEEAIRVAEPEAPDVPVPEKGWPTSGCLMGDKWSVAWRVLDAQFWGTSDKPLPQRRRRIALVADFGGHSAPEILFVRESVSGNLEPSKPKGKEAPRDAGDGSARASYGIQGSMIGRADHNGPQGDGVNEDVSFTLNTTDRHAVVYGISPYHSNCMLSDNPHSGYYEADTARTLDALQCGYPGCNQGGMAVVQPVVTAKSSSFVDVEMEVAVRKHYVDCKLLRELLRDRKASSNLSKKEIAKSLNRPLTLVEHWFRTDNGFTIPDPDVWYDLKKLLGIETTEFDQCITEFEFKASNYDMRNRIYTGDPSPTLTCGCGDNLHLLPTAYSIENHPADSRVDIDESGMVQTLTSRMGTGGGNVPMVMESVAYQKVIDQNILDDQGGSQISVRSDGKSPTLRAEMHGNVPCVMEAHAFEMQAFGQYKDSGRASSLKARDYKDATDLVCQYVDTSHADDVVRVDDVTSPLQARDYKGGKLVLASEEQPICIDRAFFNQGQNAQYDPQYYEDGTVPTLVARGPAAVAQAVRVKHIVRRLTPLECERLQGFPDGWTDIGEWVDSKGKKHKEADSPRYKALGNSIAIPPWKWVLKRLCGCYERDATMASLFDGIGGFPYIWEQLNGKGSCRWSSEIEEFPMAVTKLRFGGSTNG